MQPISGNQRPHLLTSLMSMSLVLRLPRKMHLCRSSWNVPRLPSFLEMLLRHPHVFLTFGPFGKVQNPLGACHAKPHLNLQKWSEHVVFSTCWLGNVRGATMACTCSTCQLPKAVRHWGVLHILTSRCASHHNGVHFLNSATPKSAPSMVSFVHIVTSTNVLRATTACTFSSSQLPKDSKSAPRMVFCTFWIILTWKCASRHNGAQFFISDLAWLRTRRFSEPTFRPSGATIIGKTQCFATFLPFRTPASSVFWLFLFSDLLSSSLLFSDSSHLCFFIVHINWNLTSKFPSIMIIEYYKHAHWIALNLTACSSMAHVHPGLSARLPVQKLDDARLVTSKYITSEEASGLSLPNRSWQRVKKCQKYQPLLAYMMPSEMVNKKYKCTNYYVFTLSFFILPYRFTGFRHSAIIRQIWRGSCTCGSRWDFTCSISIELCFYSWYRTYLPWRKQRFLEQIYCSHVATLRQDSKRRTLFLSLGLTCWTQVTIWFTCLRRISMAELAFGWILLSFLFSFLLSLCYIMLYRVVIVLCCVDSPNPWSAGHTWCVLHTNARGASAAAF